jgi:hypothetical protein
MQCDAQSVQQVTYHGLYFEAKIRILVCRTSTWQKKVDIEVL